MHFLEGWIFILELTYLSFCILYYIIYVYDFHLQFSLKYRELERVRTAV